VEVPLESGLVGAVVETEEKLCFLLVDFVCFVYSWL